VLHDHVDPSADPVREQLAAAAGVDADENLGRPSRDTDPLSKRGFRQGVRVTASK
jgi:hypothetical protein